MDVLLPVHQMLPAVAGLLPLYIFARYLGLLDNINYLFILYTAMNLPIAVWMMRSFLADVPYELMKLRLLNARPSGAVQLRPISPGLAPPPGRTMFA